MLKVRSRCLQKVHSLHVVLKMEPYSTCHSFNTLQSAIRMETNPMAQIADAIQLHYIMICHDSGGILQVG